MDGATPDQMSVIMSLLDDKRASPPVAFPKILNQSKGYCVVDDVTYEEGSPMSFLFEDCGVSMLFVLLSPLSLLIDYDSLSFLELGSTISSFVASFSGFD